MNVRKSLLFFALAVATSGLLSSCMEIAIRSENWKSLDLYGKIVDQYGMPVVAAKVRGGIGLNINMVESGGKFVYTETDEHGCFHFLHIHGTGIGIWPQKEGYYYNLKLGPERPGDYKPDPKNPIIFPMWKIRRAEPLITAGVDAKNLTNGSAITLDTETGKESSHGDFRVIFSSFQPASKPGLIHPYNWGFKIEMLNGGLLPEKDPYPYLAPNRGYEPFFEFSIKSNSPSWHSQFSQTFYVRDSQGRYGRLIFEIYSARNPSFFHANFIMNPSGSQNLEPDFSK